MLNMDVEGFPNLDTGSVWLSIQTLNMSDLRSLMPLEPLVLIKLRLISSSSTPQ